MPIMDEIELLKKVRSILQGYKTGHTLRLPIGPFLKFQQ